MEEKVSIIIPIYNAEKYLEKCLESVIKQTYKNMEIICINDGSKDNSEKILKKYEQKDDRILTKTIKNSGVSKARNIAIKQASGKYIMFVDSDDYIEINMVEEMVKAINQSQADIVRCTNFLEEENGNLIKIEKAKLKGKFVMEEELQEKILSQIIMGELQAYSCVLIIRRELLNKTNLYNEKLKILEDKALYIELFLKAHTVYFLDKPLYHYVLNSKSCTNHKELVTRNMYNLLDGWQYTNEILKTAKLKSTKLQTQLNTKYLIGITGFLFETYRYNRKEFKRTYNNLINNENFKNIIKDYDIKKFGIHINISINLIIHKHYKLLRMFYWIRNIIKTCLCKSE